MIEEFNVDSKLSVMSLI